MLAEAVSGGGCATAVPHQPLPHRFLPPLPLLLLLLILFRVCVWRMCRPLYDIFENDRGSARASYVLCLVWVFSAVYAEFVSRDSGDKYGANGIGCAPAAASSDGLLL